MQKLPFFKQQTDYYCGPAVVQSVLAAHGVKIGQRTLAKRMKTNKKVGTHPYALVSLLQKEGFEVEVAQMQSVADLKKALRQKKIPIVLFIEPIAEWDHYAIVRKIEKGKISLLDPDARTGRTNMVEKEFLRRWKDRDVLKSTRWAAVVSKKSTARLSKQRPRRHSLRS